MALDGYSQATLFKAELPIFIAGIFLLAYFDEIYSFKSVERKAIKILNGLISIFFFGTGILLVLVGAYILNNVFLNLGCLPVVILGLFLAIGLRWLAIKYRRIP